MEDSLEGFERLRDVEQRALVGVLEHLDDVHRLLLDELSHDHTVLVVEDVHWADDATIDALVVAGRRIGKLPSLVVVTCRDGEVPEGVHGAVDVIESGDMTFLEEGQPRKDLACTVTPEKPQLGFDLRFHAGYDVTIPLRDLSGSENMLTIVFRVTGVPETSIS